MSGKLFRLTLDFETRWSADYTLKKMPASLYVRDPRFHAHGASVKVNDNKAQWVTGSALPRLFDAVPWERAVVLGHNVAGFDALILEWVYGRKPAMYIDTMGMSRAVLGSLPGRHSLDVVGQYLGLGGKKDYANFLNTRGLDFLSADDERALAPYAIQDAELCYAIFKRLHPSFPPQQYRVLDWTAKIACRPLLRLNGPLLHEAHAEEVERKKQLVDRLGVPLPTYRSNDKFAALLRAHLEPYGMDVPTKASKTVKNADGTPAMTYAFAASDEEFCDLLEHPDETIAALVETRLGVKGSTVETRTAMMARIADTMPNSLWPVGLSYSGAVQTQRFSGNMVGGGNPQNLKRGSKMRDAIVAPPGYVIVAVDLSQIELRTAAYMVGQEDILTMLVAGDDLYSYFAGHIYEREINKKDHPDERQIGKVACIAEDAPVLTHRGEVRIQHVQPDDLLWDGVAFVPHAGVVYKGYRDVIEYDGVVATQDHVVHTVEQGWIELGEAAARGCRVTRTARYRHEARPVASDRGACASRQETLPVVPVRVWDGETCEREQPASWAEHQVHSVRPTHDTAGVEQATLTSERHEAAVHEPERPFLAPVWGAGDTVSLRVSGRMRPLDSSDIAGVGIGGDRPSGQRRALRAGELEAVYAHGERPQHHARYTGALARGGHATTGLGGEPIPPTTEAGGCSRAVRQGRPDRGADYSEGVAVGEGKTQGVAQHRGKAHVYDTVNAGPRSRFTVNGRLVHNCLSLGYGAQYAAFKRMLLVQAKKVVTPEFAQLVVHKFREVYTAYPDGWGRCKKTLSAWCKGEVPGENWRVRLPAVFQWGVGEVTTPSGLKLKYPDMMQVKVFNKFLDQYQYQYVFRGADPKKSFEIDGHDGRWQRVYGAHLLENFSQNAAREVIDAKCMKLRLQHPWIDQTLQVHDEIVAVVPISRAKEAALIMSGEFNTPVDWWPDLPIAAETGVDVSYGKLKKYSHSVIREKYA
jgi:hypothetical protein